MEGLRTYAVAITILKKKKMIDLSEILIKQIAYSHSRNPDSDWPVLQSAPLLSS